MYKSQLPRTMARGAIALIATLPVAWAGPSSGAVSALMVEKLQGRWVLSKPGALPVVPSAAGAAPWFSITGRSIEGSDGCNEFAGSLDTPGSVVTTRRACPDGVMKLPLDLSDPWAQLNAATVVDGQMIVPAVATMPAFQMRRAR